MVKFKLEDDDAQGGRPGKLPGRGNLGAPRTKGSGTVYPVGDGPQGSGGGHQLGPNGTTGGAGGTRVKAFGGSPKGFDRSLPYARNQSNPMKR